MNPYNWSGLYSLVANIIIGIFVYSKAPTKKINILFLFFSLGIAGWSVGSSLVNIIQDKQMALWVLRGNYSFAVLLPAIYVHFIYVLVGKTSKIIKFNYFVSSLLLVFVFTPFFIRKLKVIPNTNFYISDPGPIYYIFFVFFAISMLEILFQTFNRLNFFSNRGQFYCIAIANCLAIFSGFEYFSRVFGFFKTPPFDDFFLILYVLIVAFAIIKYDVFNLDAIAQAFQREKLATIGLLAASVNHEIRNPLYVAKTSLESFLEKEQENKEAKRSLSAVNRALEVITKLNRFAKPTNEVKNKSQGARIGEAVQNVLDLVSYEFELDKIKIINGIPSDLPSIQADQRQLEEILFNLIVNACHAMSQSGTLTLRSTTYDSRLTLEISDTGSGISQDQMKHLFEPFHTTKGENGTGLGLYITKQLVECNGGKISISSKPNQGTSFILEFKTI